MYEYTQRRFHVYTQRERVRTKGVFRALPSTGQRNMYEYTSSLSSQVYTHTTSARAHQRCRAAARASQRRESNGTARPPQTRAPRVWRSPARQTCCPPCPTAAPSCGPRHHVYFIYFSSYLQRIYVMLFLSPGNHCSSHRHRTVQTLERDTCTCYHTHPPSEFSPRDMQVAQACVE